MKTVSVILFISLISSAQTLSPLAVYLDKAVHGDVGAQFWLGVAYESGRGIKQDFAEAIKWLGKAAKQGNPDAEVLLGQMCEDAEGLPQDYVKAAEWYRLACENRPDRGGTGQGCNNLGLLYLDGKGVKRNTIEAYMYFKIAGIEGNLDFVKRSMTAEEIDEAERQTDQWMEAHPDQ
jgi:TPR repeat protein